MGLYDEDGKNSEPYSIEAEEALLGSVFINPNVIGDVVDIITAEYFYKSNYKLIFSNCSFEVWLLYHYENIMIGECSQKNYENILTRKLNKKYKKSEGIKFTLDDKERAIRQSKKIHEKYQRLEEKINNSFNCTKFYMILEKFKEVFYNFDLE